jgi:hypothetical protein
MTRMRRSDLRGECSPQPRRRPFGDPLPSGGAPEGGRSRSARRNNAFYPLLGGGIFAVSVIPSHAADSSNFNRSALLKSKIDPSRYVGRRRASRTRMPTMPIRRKLATRCGGTFHEESDDALQPEIHLPASRRDRGLLLQVRDSNAHRFALYHLRQNGTVEKVGRGQLRFRASELTAS